MLFLSCFTDEDEVVAAKILDSGH